MNINVRCPVYPTEDIERIESAIGNLLGSHEFTIVDLDTTKEFTISSSDKGILSLVRQKIHDARIIDAARVRLEMNWNDIGTSIYLDKQAAFMNKIRIIDDTSETPPLSCIRIELVFKDEVEFRSFLLWFTPPTRGGKIVKS